MNLLLQKLQAKSSCRAGMPDTHKREIQAIFPDQDVANMLIVPTCQKTVVDLVNRGETVEQEKDHCLERFVKWAELVCEHVNAAGHWIDFIDPCSGLPVCCTLLCPLAADACEPCVHSFGVNLCRCNTGTTTSRILKWMV